MAGGNKRAPPQSDKTERRKKELVDQLRRTPLVQVACEKTGTGRSTYYDWRAHDKVFARAADRALEAGKFFVNDLAEAKLITLVQGGNLTAIIFWLKHNHPKYTVTTRLIHEYETLTERPSLEERHVGEEQVAKVLSHLMFRGINRTFTTKEMREQVEEELEAAEREAPNRERLKAFEAEDTGHKAL